MSNLHANPLSKHVTDVPTWTISRDGAHLGLLSQHSAQGWSYCRSVMLDDQLRSSCFVALNLRDALEKLEARFAAEAYLNCKES